MAVITVMLQTDSLLPLCCSCYTSLWAGFNLVKDTYMGISGCKYPQMSEVEGKCRQLSKEMVL